MPARVWSALVLTTVALATRSVRGEEVRAAPPWLREISAALDAAPIRVVSAVPGENHHSHPLSRPLSSRRCPGVQVTDPWTLTLEVSLESKRPHRLTALVGRLESEAAAYPPLLDAAAASSRCALPRSGLSLWQLGTVWMAIPGSCSDAQAYDRALVLVVDALRGKIPPHLADKLFRGGCGKTDLKVLAAASEPEPPPPPPPPAPPPAARVAAVEPTRTTLEPLGPFPSRLPVIPMVFRQGQVRQGRPQPLDRGQAGTFRIAVMNGWSVENRSVIMSGQRDGQKIDAFVLVDDGMVAHKDVLQQYSHPYFLVPAGSPLRETMVRISTYKCGAGTCKVDFGFGVREQADGE